MPASTWVTEANKAFQPFGRALEALYCQEREVLFEGPAGTGKTRLNLEKIQICCDKYAGIRVLIARKTRVSLTETVLVTWENKVVPSGSPILRGPTRAHRDSYIFPNGSEIIIGGLDHPTKILSSEYDIVYLPEAIEFSEDDWEVLKTRLRNNKMPYQQIIADTNPDKPTHWLNQRCIKGLTRRIEGRFEDNPEYWDRGKGDWTPLGRSYVVETLGSLTGVRLARYRWGKWVSAEGAVYEGYSAGKHLRSLSDIRDAQFVNGEWHLPLSWRRFWTVDFGFTNPFVWQQWAIDGDGRFYRELEIYRTQRLVEDHAKDILRATAGKNYPLPEVIICDHDTEDRATLEKHLGMGTVAAVKDVSTGIQAVMSRLNEARDGLPRLIFVREALVERDQSLDARKLPACTEEEIDGYVWRQPKAGTQGAQKKGEEPVKMNDHGCDATRYGVAHFDLIPAVIAPSVVTIPETVARFAGTGLDRVPLIRLSGV